MKWFLATVIGIAFFSGGEDLPAREIHVAKTGSDSASGAQASPYLTIGKAAQVALRLVKILGPSVLESLRARADAAISEAQDNPLSTLAKAVAVIAEHTKDEDEPDWEEKPGG